MQSLYNKRELDDLIQTIHDFIMDLSIIFTSSDEKADLTFVEFFFKKLHKERVMIYTIETLLPYKTQVENRELAFFKDNLYIFNGLEKARIEHYKNAILNMANSKSSISKNNINMIWEYFEVIIALVEAYQK